MINSSTKHHSQLQVAVTPINCHYKDSHHQTQHKQSTHNLCTNINKHTDMQVETRSTSIEAKQDQKSRQRKEILSTHSDGDRL